VVASKPWLTIATLVAGDVLTLTALMAGTVWVRFMLGGVFELQTYWQLWPALVLFVAVYALLGLYPGVGLSVPEEIRRVFTATTTVYLLLGSTTFLFKEAETFSRAIFLVAWVLSLVGVPLTRALLRHWFAAQPWWGYPVVIMGAGKTGEEVARAMQRQPGLGFKPVAFLDDDHTKQGECRGIPVLGGLALAPKLAREWGVRHAVLAIPGISRPRLLEVIERYGSAFPKLTLIPDLFGMASLWVSATDMGGILGLDLRHNLLQPSARWLKRGLDLMGVLVGGLLLLPLLALIALLIRLDSSGPVGFAHERLGKDGRRFRALKFRTMVQNADEVLCQALKQDPALRAEWERDQKLRRDPRITRVGAWLRRTSLDELPQLWNVLVGEMSLVGPRPIVQAEVERYGDRFSLYAQVLPGMTGLWQVSGRNQTPYAQRVALDTYYVRNWSPWLDFYLLARTVWAVLWSDGAY
jgi:Undecaprenyl-phosphate galactose phosphotransferase WbaP